MSEEKKVNSYLERLKQKAKAQENYGGKTDINEAKMDARACPNCGAGRAIQDGVTHCAYCGFQFMTGKLTDGVYLKEEDNSEENK